jgi:hypothetical protein
VNGTATFADERLERKIVKPAATISRPNRLSGRHHHAMSPANTYVCVIPFMSAACTPGALR